MMMMMMIAPIGVRANIHLGRQTEFCPNGFGGGGGSRRIFPMTAVTYPKFGLFKHVLCFARIMSTLCPN